MPKDTKMSEAKRYKKFCLAKIQRKVNEVKKMRQIPADHKYFINMSYYKIKKQNELDMRRNMLITRITEKLLHPVQIEIIPI